MYSFRVLFALTVAATSVQAQPAAPQPTSSQSLVASPAGPPDALSADEQLREKESFLRENLGAPTSMALGVIDAPFSVLKAILLSLRRAGTPEAALPARLLAKADTYIILSVLTLDPLPSQPGALPDAAPARQEARALVTAGDFDGALAVLAKEQARLSAGHASPRDAAGLMSMQARILLLAARHRDAAKLWDAAAAVTPDAVFAWSYRVAAAEALREAWPDIADVEALRDAVAAYRAALGHPLPPGLELNAALAQMSLGHAARDLAEQDSANSTPSLEIAAAAFHAALVGLPREMSPERWALTQNDLGDASGMLGIRDGGTARLLEAVAAYRAAFEEQSRDSNPMRLMYTYQGLEKLYTMNRLGSAVTAWSERTAPADASSPRDAVAKFRTAIEEVRLSYKRDVAERAQADRVPRPRDAVVMLRAAIDERAPAFVEGSPAGHNLASALSSLAELTSDVHILRDAAKYRAALVSGLASPVATPPNGPPRAAPALGTSFRVQTYTASVGDRRVPITREVRRRITNVADGGIWSAVNTPVSVPDKPRPANQPASLTPTAADYTETFHGFLLADSVMTLSDSRFDKPDVGRPYRISVDCPWSEFDRFLPLGSAPQISMNCNQSTSYGDEPRRESAVHFTVSDEGPDTARIASRELPARRIRVIQSHSDGSVFERTQLFSEQYGVALVSDGISRSGSTRLPTVTIVHTETTPEN